MEKILYWILNLIIQYAVLLFAISIHESAHAWMAYKFGDPTGKNQGRITLNPIPHIDPIGTIIFPLVLTIMGSTAFGWAKPVMVNPYNLRNPRRDIIFISAAGPAANIIAAVSGIIIFLLLKNNLGPQNEIVVILLYVFLRLITINILLVIFNLLPIPPLDGSGILEGLLKGEALYYYNKIKPYGPLIMLLIIFTPIFQMIANPILSFVFNILRG